MIYSYYIILPVQSSLLWSKKRCAIRAKTLDGLNRLNSESYRSCRLVGHFRAIPQIISSIVPGTHRLFPSMSGAVQAKVNGREPSLPSGCQSIQRLTEDNRLGPLSGLLLGQ